MHINILLLFKLLTSLFILFMFEPNSYIKNQNIFVKCNDVNKWNSHKEMISKIKNFKANGVLTYKSGIKIIFLSFYWDNIYPKYFDFKAYTFFGLKLIEFIYNSENAYLKNYGMKPLIEDNPQYIFEKVSKTSIPVKNLRFWLIGLPGDSKKFILNKFGYLKEINYSINDKHYKIIYYKYNNNINPPLPEIIEFHQGNSKINLKIKCWNFS